MYNRVLIFRLNIHFVQTVMISVIEELRVNFRLRSLNPKVGDETFGVLRCHGTSERSVDTVIVGIVS